MSSAIGRAMVSPVRRSVSTWSVIASTISVVPPTMPVTPGAASSRSAGIVEQARLDLVERRLLLAPAAGPGASSTTTRKPSPSCATSGAAAGLAAPSGSASGSMTDDDAVDRRRGPSRAGASAVGHLGVGRVDAVERRGSATDRCRRPRRGSREPSRALRPGTAGCARAQPVEQVLPVHAEDGQAVPEHGEDQPRHDGEAGMVGDCATYSGEHAGHRRRWNGRLAHVVTRWRVGAARRRTASDVGASAYPARMDLFDAVTSTASGPARRRGRRAARRPHAAARPERGRRPGAPARRRARRCAGWSSRPTRRHAGPRRPRSSCGGRPARARRRSPT